MRLACLGSGSRGNATLLQIESCHLLIDCGLGIRETEKRLKALGVAPEQITAILVTHEHQDHIHGVESLAAKYRLPVFMTEGTRNNWRSKQRVSPTIISADQPVEFEQGVTVTPVAVPHDAREPVQFVVDYPGGKLGVLTDLGSLPPNLYEAYAGCTSLLIEANHDLDMLREGPYPASLKRRVSGDWGHLNNRQALQFVQKLTEGNGLNYLVVGHISEQNNCPNLIAGLFEAAQLAVDRFCYVRQGDMLNWLSLVQR